MRYLLSLVALWLFTTAAHAEAFYITHYNVHIHLTQQGVMEVTETIDLLFTEERHGILRKMPFLYSSSDVPQASRAERSFESGTDEIRLFYKNIEVDGWPFETYEEGYNMIIRIGDPDKMVSGEQRMVIRYKVYNVINFFADHSELYWNVVGTEWETEIREASIKVDWDTPLPPSYLPQLITAEGGYGTPAASGSLTLAPSRQSVSGHTQQSLSPFEGYTVGISFPGDFIKKTPLPPQALANKYFVNSRQVEVKVQRDGTSKVTERLQLTFTDKAYDWRRSLRPYSDQPNQGMRDWTGGRYRYLLKNLEHKCLGFQPKVCFEVKKIAGDQATVEWTYEVYGNWVPSGDGTTGLLSYSDPGAAAFGEPVMRSSVRVEMPEDSPENEDVVFHAFVNDGPELKDAAVYHPKENVWEGVSNKEYFLMPDEALTFELQAPANYFSGGSTMSNLALIWRNNRFLFLPILIFLGLYLIWDRWGRDESFSTAVQYYPPTDLPPSEAGILIDDKLHDRDLLVLIPYWGAQGLIEIKELEKKLLSSRDYEFKMVKPLPTGSPVYESTMWNGIFGYDASPGDTKLLSSLKEKFYTTLSKARKELEKRIKDRSFYQPRSRGAGTALKVLGIILVVLGVLTYVFDFLNARISQTPEPGIGLFLSGIISFIFGRIMPKKAPKGLESYRHLDGFRLFIKDAEMPRLETFLKEDPQYFDKTLPYAIVFDLVDTWSDKFKDLTVPPPQWYHSSTPGPFTTSVFTHDLSRAMRNTGNTFSSTPSSSGSGGSFSGGGFSGGGFGGGGGSSW